MENLFELLIVTLYGLCIGSFLNVVIYRIGKSKETIVGRSCCPKCKTQLKWYHNIPLFSWLFLRGKCSFCKNPISIQYPLIEFITMIIGLITYYHDGFTFYSLATFLTFTTLLAISTIDIKYKMVPDSLSLLALFFSYFHSKDILLSLEYSLILMGSFYIIRLLGEFVFKKEIMGEGDIVIAGIIGSMLPSFGLFMTSIFITALVALIPSIYTKYKYKSEDSIEIDTRFEKIEINVDNMIKEYKDDVVYQEKLRLLKDGISDFKIKDNAPQGIPFIPYLTIGLVITYFANLNFYLN